MTETQRQRDTNTQPERERQTDRQTDRDKDREIYTQRERGGRERFDLIDLISLLGG